MRRVTRLVLAVCGLLAISYATLPFAHAAAVNVTITKQAQDFPPGTVDGGTTITITPQAGAAAPAVTQKADGTVTITLPADGQYSTHTAEVDGSGKELVTIPDVTFGYATLPPVTIQVPVSIAICPTDPTTATVSPATLCPTP